MSGCRRGLGVLAWLRGGTGIVKIGLGFDKSGVRFHPETWQKRAGSVR